MMVDGGWFLTRKNRARHVPTFFLLSVVFIGKEAENLKEAEMPKIRGEALG
jgi:hypothetical protein